MSEYAFPLTGLATDEDLAMRRDGMTLRDYFAAAALTGMLASESEEFCWKNATARARQAYAEADAMLEARKP